METAFVLGGGGVLGAHEIGMLRALSQAGIRPDVVVGTSVGAINGSFVAADPAGAAARLGRLWQGDALGQAFSETLWGRAVQLARSGTHLHSIEPLRQVLADQLPAKAFEIARRYRFHEEMSALPDNVRVHVMPAGAIRDGPDLSQRISQPRLVVARLARPDGTGYGCGVASVGAGGVSPGSGTASGTAPETVQYLPRRGRTNKK
jgi:hypothetical protein